MKRELLVPNEQKALELMQAKLAETFPNGVLDIADCFEDPSRKLFLMWLSRDHETDEWIGCPCFVCDFSGKKEGKEVHGIIFVKIFAQEREKMTQMYFIEPYLEFGFNEIEEGQTIEMHDERGRYEDETFIFRHGEICPA